MSGRALGALAASSLLALLAITSLTGLGGPLVCGLELAATLHVYLPYVMQPDFATPTATPYGCPATSANEYGQGVAYRFDRDNPVRPAAQHADKNLALRGYAPNTDPAIIHGLVNYGSGDPTQPPQFATLFDPYRAPSLSSFQRVHHWNWAPSPDPGTRDGPILAPPVTALGLQTTPGDVLRVPASGYDIGGGMEVVVLFADEDSVTLRYSRDDSAAPAGYTLHLDGLCTDPNLLSLYRALDDPAGPRYVFSNTQYHLPTLYAGQVLGTARGTEIVVAIADAGTFQDPRSCNEWWQIRPGYTGACPPHE